MSRPGFDTTTPLLLWSTGQDISASLNFFTIPPSTAANLDSTEEEVEGEGSEPRRLSLQDIDYSLLPQIYADRIFSDEMTSMCGFSMRTTIRPENPETLFDDVSDSDSDDAGAGGVDLRSSLAQSLPRCERIVVTGSRRGDVVFWRLRMRDEEGRRRLAESRELDVVSGGVFPCHFVARCGGLALRGVHGRSGRKARGWKKVRQIEVQKVPLANPEMRQTLVYASSRGAIRVFLCDSEFVEEDELPDGFFQRTHYEDAVPSGGFHFPKAVRTATSRRRGRPQFHPSGRFWTRTFSTPILGTEKIKAMSPCIGQCGRVAMVVGDPRDKERDIVQVADFGHLGETFSLRETPEVVWRYEKSMGGERAKYTCCLAGSGILGGASSSSDAIVAAAGHGYPEAFRTTLTRDAFTGGPLVDIFDFRMSPKKPVVQIFSAYESQEYEPFRSLARVRIPSGWGLLTTTSFGRVQLWDPRMLKSSPDAQLQSRCDGSLSLGDWCIVPHLATPRIPIEPVLWLGRSVVDRLQEDDSTDLGSESESPKEKFGFAPGFAESGVSVIDTPAYGSDDVYEGVQKKDRRCQVVSLGPRKGSSEVMITTNEAMLRWSAFGSGENPKIEDIRHSFIPRFAHPAPTSVLPMKNVFLCGYLGGEDQDDVNVLSPVPVGRASEEDVLLKKIEGVIGLLPNFADFQIRTPLRRIKFFRSFLLDSRYVEMILKKKFARIRWEIPSVTADDLLRFLVGVPSALSPESLLDYFILFLELGMTGRMFFVCLRAECLCSQPGVVMELLTSARARLPEIFETRNAATGWEECPFVGALLTSLKESEQLAELLTEDSNSWLRELIARSSVPVFRNRVFRRVRRSSPKSLLRKAFKCLSKRTPPTGNVSFSIGSDSDERRVHAECLVYKSEFFRALFAFGGSDSASASQSYDVHETFPSEECLNSYLHYVYSGSLPDEISATPHVFFEILGVSDRLFDANLTRLGIDCIFEESKTLFETDRLKGFLLQEGQLLLEVGREWIQRELLSCWTTLLEEEEVLRLLHMSTKPIPGVSLNPTMTVIFCGLDNAGKTTLLNSLKPEKTKVDPAQIEPTFGYQQDGFHRHHIDFVAFDMSGRTSYRPLWEEMARSADAIAFVIDATDATRLVVAQDELRNLVLLPGIKEKPVLIFANKQDLSAEAKTPEMISEELGLAEEFSEENIRWRVFGSCALDGLGVDEGLKWLSEQK